MRRRRVSPRRRPWSGVINPASHRSIPRIEGCYARRTTRRTTRTRNSPKRTTRLSWLRRTSFLTEAHNVGEEFPMDPIQYSNLSSRRPRAGAVDTGDATRSLLINPATTPTERNHARRWSFFTSRRLLTLLDGGGGDWTEGKGEGV